MLNNLMKTNQELGKVSMYRSIIGENKEYAELISIDKEYPHVEILCDVLLSF